MLEESVSLKGENNSLKKKVQSLQIDVEKMSRKIDTTRTASIGEESGDDGMFNVVNEDVPGTATSLNNANVLVGLGTSNQNPTTLKQSIRSDGIQTRTNRFDMMIGEANERHDTITLSDEEVEPDFGAPSGGKK